MKDKLIDDYESACYNYIAEFGRISGFDFEGCIGVINRMCIFVD